MNLDASLTGRSVIGVPLYYISLIYLLELVSSFERQRRFKNVCRLLKKISSVNEAFLMTKAAAVRWIFFSFECLLYVRPSDFSSLFKVRHRI